jgi:hypothetical protein
MAGLLTLDLICSYKMRITSPASTPGRRSLTGEAWRLVAEPQVALLVGWCTTVGVLTALIWQWLPWFLSDLASLQAHNQVVFS